MAENPSYPAGGGGIRNSDGGVVIIDTNSLLTSNQAVYGGGIHSELGSTITINASSIGNNRAYRDGGGIYSEGVLDVDASMLSGNQASGGGAILNWKTGSVSISNNSRLEGNVANGGGAIENGSDLSCAICNATVTIDSNSALRNNRALFYGGAIWNFGSNSQVIIKNSRLENNEAYNPTDPSGLTYGGGIHNTDSATMSIEDGTMLTGNRASYGGGIHNEVSGIVTIGGESDISSNIASGDGGGIYNEGEVEVSKSKLTHNQARGGGAILNWASGVLEIEASALAFNQAGFGGAIQNGCRDESTPCGKVTTRNSTLSTNSGSSSGGAIANFSSGDVNIHDSTLSFNTAPTGSTIKNFTSVGTIHVNRSIVAYGRPGANCSGTVTSMGYNLESSNTCGFTAIGDKVNADPLLGPLSACGSTVVHPIPKRSPAANAIPAGFCAMTVDQCGTSWPQPQGGFCDIGAYEVAYPGQNVNNRLQQVSVAGNYTSPGPSGYVGTYTINATFANQSANTMQGLFFKTVNLQYVQPPTEGLVMLNADGTPKAVGSVVSVPASALGSDGVLTPGETFTVQFQIGLTRRFPFWFYVDAYGVVTPATGAVDPSTDRVMATSPAKSFAFDVQAQQLQVDQGSKSTAPVSSE